MTSPTPVVAGIIEDGSGQILICERPPGKRLAGFWEFPGGKIEDGETPAQALIRELQEELELQVHVDRYLGVFPYAYEWGAIDLHVFVVKALTLPKPTESIQKFIWQTAQDVRLEIMAAADHKPLLVYIEGSGPRQGNS